VNRANDAPKRAKEPSDRDSDSSERDKDDSENDNKSPEKAIDPSEVVISYPKVKHVEKRKLLKILAIILRFIYMTRARISARNYVAKNATLMKIKNARSDKLGKFFI